MGNADARLRKAGFASLLKSSGADITALLRTSGDLLAATGNRNHKYGYSYVVQVCAIYATPVPVLQASVFNELISLQEGHRRLLLPIHL